MSASDSSNAPAQSGAAGPGDASRTMGPAERSTGPGAYTTSEPGARGDISGGPAARSQGTGASGDIGAVERSPVAGRDDASPMLDDAAIVAVTNAANKAEVEQGRLARERAKDPRVRDFAAMMVDHHTEALRNQQKLAITPQPRADVLNMERQSQQSLDSLRDKKGSEFDRAYLALQIEEHRRLLAKINQELMPAAKDKNLVSYLEEIRPRVESHLSQAERLQQELSTQSSDTSRTTITNKPGAAPRVTDPE